MELTPGQRRAAFLVIVLALAGLGAYLIVPAVFGPGRRTVSPSAAQTPVPSATTSVPAPVPSTPEQTAPPPAAPSTGPVIGSSAGAIYQWLPFRPADLAAAAEVAVQFGNLYGTFSYSESASAYARSLQSVTTGQLEQQLQRAYATPGLSGPRVSQQQVATGKTTVSSLRAFGSGSLTFIVSISQKITSTKGTSHTSTQYAETVVGGAGSWQVNDIEPASAGNF